MTLIEAFILIGVGLITGFINTLAGGGSLITLPVLIFMGLPPSVANGTNRVGIFLQALVSVGGFKSKGIFVFPYAAYASITATLGCIIGAYFAVDFSGDLFNKILAVVMILVMVFTVLKPYTKKKVAVEVTSEKSKLFSISIFFLVGLYGGFIQAGVGFLIIATLTGVHGFGMAKTNAIKLFVVACYTAVAVGIFWWEDQIRWDYGLTLAAGNSVGGWIASRWSVGKDDKWIQVILLITVFALAIKLWFFG